MYSSGEIGTVCVLLETLYTFFKVPVNLGLRLAAFRFEVNQFPTSLDFNMLNMKVTQIDSWLVKSCLLLRCWSRANFEGAPASARDLIKKSCSAAAPAPGLFRLVQSFSFTLSL